MKLKPVKPRICQRLQHRHLNLAKPKLLRLSLC